MNGGGRVELPIAMLNARDVRWREACRRGYRQLRPGFSTLELVQFDAQHGRVHYRLYHDLSSPAVYGFATHHTPSAEKHDLVEDVQHAGGGLVDGHCHSAVPLAHRGQRLGDGEGRGRVCVFRVHSFQRKVCKKGDKRREGEL